MKKIFLFAVALALGGIAFAQDVPQEVCEFFGHPHWQPVSIKGCLTCPVRDAQGKYVKCETPGNTNGDCCWLNTPPQQPVTGNCYTNAYALNWGPGSPWARRCIALLNDLLAQGGVTGGTGTNGGNNGGNGANSVKDPGKVVKPLSTNPGKGRERHCQPRPHGGGTPHKIQQSGINVISRPSQLLGT